MSSRLTEVSDSAGAVITRAVYSASGEFVNVPTADYVNLPDGQKITRVFSNDRLAFVADENGARVDFSYGSKGNIRELTIRSRNGLSWKIEYGKDRRLRGVLDPVGRATGFECDQQGRIVSVALPGKFEVIAKCDHQDRIVEISTVTGESWKALFSANGMLTSVSASPRKRIEFKYARGLLSGLKVTGGSLNSGFHVGPRPNPIGRHLDFQFDGPGFGEKVGRRFVGRHRIKRKIGPYGKSVKTQGPAGTISVSSPTANLADVVVEFS
jgi:YD repeat-containing protein